MAIDQANVVDSIGVDPIGDEAQLIISDHIGWNESEEKDREHMYLLQEKINAYLRFIESGEIYAAYPKAKGKKAVIRVIARYDMSEDGQNFFKKIEETLSTSGHKITFERLGLVQQIHAAQHPHAQATQMDRFSDHQHRLWQQMLQIISDYQARVITYPDMVGSLEGALDAGEFKDVDIRQKWYDLWTPLEILRATGATNGDSVDEHISRMKRYLEEELVEISRH